MKSIVEKDKINKYKEKLQQILNWCILLSPIIIMVSYLFEKNFFARKVLTLSILLSILLMSVTSVLKKEYMKINTLIKYLFILLVIVHYIFNFNDEGITKYLLVTALFLIYFCKDKNKKSLREVIQSNTKIIEIMLSVSEIIMILFCFLKVGYTDIWEGNYYIGPFSNPHTTTYYLIVLMIFATILRKKNNNIINNIFLIVPLILSFITGARVPFLGAVIVFLYNYYLDYTKNKRLFKYETIVFVSISIIVIILLLFNIIEIPVLNKIFDTLREGNFSNSRNHIWRVNLIVFSESNIFRMLFGYGAAYPFEITQYYLQARVWAHNDFIQILVSYGLVGLAIYMYILIDFFVKNRNIFIIMLLLFLAIVNGMFTYDVFIMALPLLQIIGD